MVVKTESLWVDTTPKTHFNPLTKDTKIDVAIIGAGIAGLTSAYFLSKAGLKVAVLDQDRIIKGTTGYTTAKITSAHGQIYQRLVAIFGAEKARLYASSNQEAILKISETIEKEKIACDFQKTNAYTYVVSKSGITALKKEYEACKSLNLPVSLQTNFDLPFKTSAAICFENQAQFHPRKYLLALAKKIIALGGHIFEQTKVSDIKNTDPLSFNTSKRNLKASYIIIATRNPFIKNNPYLPFLIPHQAYIVAVKTKKIPFKGMFYSGEEGSYSLRTHEGREGKFILIAGSEKEIPKVSNSEAYYQKLEEFARKKFDIEQIAYRWAAQDNYTRDMVPFIGQATPDNKNIFLAAGFGAWGMTNGTVAGMLMSDLVLHRKNPCEEIYNPLRIYKTKKTEDKMVKKSKEDLISEISAGEGDVIKVGLLKKLAIYKDEKGEVTVLSPICRHLGCTVGWNNKDKTWDCPCHGSRYDKFGKVIHGPAKKDLPKKEL